MWSKEGEPYLTLGLYVDIGEELSDDEAAAAKKQIAYEDNAKIEKLPCADESGSIGASHEILSQDNLAFPESQVCCLVLACILLKCSQDHYSLDPPLHCFLYYDVQNEQERAKVSQPYSFFSLL